MLNQLQNDIHGNTTGKAGPKLCGKLFDLENIMSIQSIRTHTKTDDVPFVTDEQLSLYRRGAFESAEHYTGFFLFGQKQITEKIRVQNKFARSDPFGARQSRFKKQELKYPSSDGYVYAYGLDAGAGLIRIEPGEQIVEIPYQYISHSLQGDCCLPCGSNITNDKFSYYLTYLAGFCDPCDIPAGVLIGCLRWISWSVMHPGDEIMTVRNALNEGTKGITGTNNVAFASGALEMWRQYNKNDY